MLVGKRNEFGLKKALYKLPCSRPRSIKISPKSEAKRVKAKKAKRLFQRKMTVRLPSPQLVLLCSLVIVAVLFQETDAWGRFRLRRVVSTPRIHLPRIRLPRIRLPRIRLPRLSLPRVSLPRIRISKGRILPHIRVSWRHGRDSGGNSGTATPPSIDPCSVIVTKSEWGAPSLKPSQSLTLPMSLVAVYACGKSCSTREACIQVAKEFHTETLNYNFMIGEEGTVFEGRGWDNFSNHFRQYGILEYGVCFIGETTTEKMFDSFTSLITCGMNLGKIYQEFTEDDLVER